MITALHPVLVATYAACAAVLALHGLHVAFLAVAALRAAPPPPVPALPPDDDLPPITVQLPLYNEAAVAERLLDAVAAFDYPRFGVQVLDDSSDATTAVVAAAVERHRAAGLAVHHLRRAGRDGFKAGALAYGLRASDAPFVAVFDADFVPGPDLLRRLVAPLLADGSAAFAQARWTHRNADASWLTRLQAHILDAHFAVEQHGRAAAGLAFTFNGTAGLWRRAAIDAAGGWRGDTLAEDLDLSLRAQAGGGRGVFLDDVEAPADLPADVHALRAQQRRWARGTAEVARLLLRPVATSPRLRVRARAFAVLHLLTPLTFVAAFGLLVLYAPAVLSGGLPGGLSAGLPGSVQALGGVGVLGMALQQAVTARRRGRSVAAALVRTPALMAGMTALVPACALAVVQAFGPRRGVFERTAKPQAGAAVAYRTARPRGMAAFETALLVYVVVGAAALVAAGAWAWLPFQALLVAALAALAFGNARDGEKGTQPVQPPQPDRTFPAPVYVKSRRPESVGDVLRP